MTSRPRLPVAEADGSPSALKGTTMQSSTRNYIEYTIAMNRRTLWPIGIWPVLPNAGVAMRIATEIQVASCYFLICCLLVPCSLHTFLSETDRARRMKTIGSVIFYTTSIIKYSFLVQHRSEISVCLAHIAKDWYRFESPVDRQIMLKDAKFGRYLASICAAFMYSGLIFYHIIMPLSSGVVVNEQNVSMRPFTCPVYDKLLDAQISPTYEIVYATHVFSAFVMYTTAVGSCSIAAVFCMHACGQFNVLISRLNKLVDGEGDGDDNTAHRMADIVEIHLRAFGFIGRVEGILNEVCLIEVFESTTIICLIGYYFMTELGDLINVMTYCVVLVSLTFNIFIFCYIGELLTEQSERVGTATYMIDWYRLRGTKARDLMLILGISRYPHSITAGKMAELSLCSFSSVMRTAVAYLNFLRTVTA